MGMSYYNAGQITLRHPMSHGLQLDVSYTLSKSIDMGSDTERSPALIASFSIIYNTWKSGLNRGPSDFDTRHLLTTDYVYQLPFGKGQQLLGGANTLTDALVGGWQLSGILRATSGLPFSLSEPGYTTNWTYGSLAFVTAPLKMRRHFTRTEIHNTSTTRIPSTTVSLPARRFAFPILARPASATTSGAMAISISILASARVGNSESLAL
jgi:hypothetical protein